MDPRSARSSAAVLLERAATTSERIVALRVAGLAAKELGELDAGLASLRRALSLAEDHDAYATAQVRMNLVGLLAARGEFGSALAQASRAEPVLRGRDADRLAANTACALARAGHLKEAHETAARALARLRTVGGDPSALTGLLTNLGLARTMRGDMAAAEDALAEAVAVGEAAGLVHQTAMSKGNLAFAVGRRGDVPRALRLFAEAEPWLSGERLAQCRFDQAEILIIAGLPGEARPMLRLALDAATANGYRCDVADGLLLLAHAELADGDPERAADTAERARAAFAEQERTGWTLLAEHLLIRARWTSGERSTILLHAATATAERLEGGGWADAAAEARIVAARVAMALGRPAGHLLASAGRSRGPTSARVAAWHAVALERAARADRRGAVAAVWAGLRVTEEHAEALGALELRARAAGFADELAGLGLGLARSARELLAVEERRRAAARPARLRPPRDPERAAALAALRALSAEHTSAIARGGVPSALSAGLEARIRACARRHPPSGVPARAPRTAEIAATLDARALVEMIAVGTDLHAVTVVDGRLRRHRLGPSGGVGEDIGLARFALRRLAEDENDPQSVAALAGSSERLDRLLLAPLEQDIGDRELVIAPTGALHGLPWATLPSLVRRPFTVVPSAGAWLRARSVTQTSGHTLLVSGPGLRHTHRELSDLRCLYPQAIVLDDPGARAETVRDALDGAALAHIAAHGEFREGNALFSRLRLSDGPLTVHDLEELAAPPHLLVLSACDIGRADGGDAVLGMAGVLLALGTATVVASVTPVRDAATPEFMAAFHRALAGGDPPARALAGVRRSPGVAGFLCLGAG
ncbi:CHAT domain-containing protein [Actinomadura fibrosa]|uniref:CHAT domain-containing protein n=2 Tax=Actinomadura fibrosa TaxID=111802 RepID=A0ABW2XGZ7_9ACTN